MDNFSSTVTCSSTSSCSRICEKVKYLNIVSSRLYGITDELA